MSKFIEAKELLDLAAEKINSQEYEKLRAEYKMDEPINLTPHKHNLIVGKAHKLCERVITFGGTEEQIELALKNLYICMDSMKHNLDYIRFARENHIPELEDKMVLEARKRIEALKNVVNK